LQWADPDAANFPAGQSLQVGASGAEENFPAVHIVQFCVLKAYVSSKGPVAGFQYPEGQGSQELEK
jgi:hypothetical protein